MTTPERILIIKSSSMGDIIHALPVAHDIRRALPQARIDWVAEESFRDIPTLSPAVANVRVTAFRRWRKAIFSGATRAEAAALRAELAGEHYDCVLDIQGLIRSALVARWTGVPSIGYTWGTIREPLASLAYARHLNLPESLGAVRRYRMAAAEALGYSIDPDRPVFGLRASGTPPARAAGRTVSFAVNTSRDEKLWPEARWIELGLALLAEGLTPILYWGGAAEEARAKRIALAIPGAIVAPRARLSDVAAGLAQASLMVGVDTGLAHLAAALGCPSVGIFVATPTETLRLIGDGPCESLGGRGRCPSPAEALEAAHRVMAAAEAGRDAKESDK